MVTTVWQGNTNSVLSLPELHWARFRLDVQNMNACRIRVGIGYCLRLSLVRT